MTAPNIFDRKLERSRRALKPPHLPDPLFERLAEDVKDRLDLIKRPFERLLVTGPFASRLAPVLAHPSRIVFACGRDVLFDDEALPFSDESFDCIVSALSLQTVDDLPGALVQLRRALKPDGLFLACLFAGETLRELREAWIQAESELRAGAALRVAPLADIRELGGLLQRVGLALPVADLDRIVLRYPNALALMQEIKSLGFAAPLAERSRLPVTSGLLAQAAAIYDRRFADLDGRVRATVDIAWLTAWSPHASQQQPLRPGSATARLADALKVEEIPVRRSDD
jgi:SAM-dependent methyltransferase